MSLIDITYKSINIKLQTVVNLSKLSNKQIRIYFIRDLLVKMASSLPSKIFIKVESTTEQQENLKSSRKSSRTLGVLQKTGTIDKENLVGRQPAFITKEQLIKKTTERFASEMILFCVFDLNISIILVTSLKLQTASVKFQLRTRHRLPHKPVLLSRKPARQLQLRILLANMSVKAIGKFWLRRDVLLWKSRWLKIKNCMKESLRSKMNLISQRACWLRPAISSKC